MEPGEGVRKCEGVEQCEMCRHNYGDANAKEMFDGSVMSSVCVCGWMCV